jgi:hypothetical protein
MERNVDPVRNLIFPGRRARAAHEAYGYDADIKNEALFNQRLDLCNRSPVQGLNPMESMPSAESPDRAKLRNAERDGVGTYQGEIR